jgi:hypothetical protein
MGMEREERKMCPVDAKKESSPSVLSPDLSSSLCGALALLI